MAKNSGASSIFRDIKQALRGISGGGEGDQHLVPRGSVQHGCGKSLRRSGKVRGVGRQGPVRWGGHRRHYGVQYRVAVLGMDGMALVSSAIFTAKDNEQYRHLEDAVDSFTAVVTQKENES